MTCGVDEQWCGLPGCLRCEEAAEPRCNCPPGIATTPVDLRKRAACPMTAVDDAEDLIAMAERIEGRAA